MAGRARGSAGKPYGGQACPGRPRGGQVGRHPNGLRLAGQGQNLLVTASVVGRQPQRSRLGVSKKLRKDCTSELNRELCQELMLTIFVIIIISIIVRRRITSSITILFILIVSSSSARIVDPKHVWHNNVDLVAMASAPWGSCQRALRLGRQQARLPPPPPGNVPSVPGPSAQGCRLGLAAYFRPAKPDLGCVQPGST